MQQQLSMTCAPQARTRYQSVLLALTSVHTFAIRNTTNSTFLPCWYAGNKKRKQCIPQPRFRWKTRKRALWVYLSSEATCYKCSTGKHATRSQIVMRTESGTRRVFSKYASESQYACIRFWNKISSQIMSKLRPRQSKNMSYYRPSSTPTLHRFRFQSDLDSVPHLGQVPHPI